MTKEIVLVPTAHLSRKSIQHVKNVIEKVKPEAVAVELCGNRYRALLMQKKASPIEFIRHGQIFMLFLSLFQQYLSKKIGLMPGSEMLEAIKLAKKKGLPIFLIDQNFIVTMKKFKKVPLIEKIRLIFFSIKGTTEMSIDDMTKMDNVALILDTLKDRLPQTYKVLVHDRNRFMAKQLKSLPFKRTVAVVGAGHAPGIMKIIKNEKKPV